MKGPAVELLPNTKCDNGYVNFQYEYPPMSCSGWYPLWWIYSAKIHVDPDFSHAMNSITGCLWG